MHSLPEALRAYKTLRAPLAAVAAKRTLLDHDSNCILPWLMQRPREVSIQAFVTGPGRQPGSCLLAGGSPRKYRCGSAADLETEGTRNSRSFAGKFREAASGSEACAKTRVFRVSPGFDFMIDSREGNAYLIEMNARATQTCPLPLGPGRDLISSLCAALTGQLFSRPPIQLSGDTIALFPMAWHESVARELFISFRLSRPSPGEPELVQLGMQQLRVSPQEKWIRLFSTLGMRRL